MRSVHCYRQRSFSNTKLNVFWMLWCIFFTTVPHPHRHIGISKNYLEMLWSCKRGFWWWRYVIFGVIKPVFWLKKLCWIQGELAQMQTQNPIVYVDFEQGRMKFFGAFTFPKNKYMVLKFGARDQVMCEDVFEHVVRSLSLHSVFMNILSTPCLSVCDNLIQYISVVHQNWIPYRCKLPNVAIFPVLSGQHFLHSYMITFVTIHKTTDIQMLLKLQRH